LFYKELNMRIVVGSAVLLLALTVAASTGAAPPKKAPPPQASLDADKLAPGVFNGTIVSPPNADRIFTVNVAYKKIQLKPGTNLGRINQGLQRQYNRIIQLQNQMQNQMMQPVYRGRRGRGGPNPMQTMQQLQNAVAQFERSLAQAEANLFQVVNATQKVDFQAEENVKVRVMELPEQFDDKGNIRKYTREELAELKGKDKRLPGYESSIDSLRVGQVVSVRLGVHKKPKPKPSLSTGTAKDSDKDKDADKDKPKEKEKDKPKEPVKDDDASVQHKHQVQLIVIVKESASSGSSGNQGKGKKRK
jgi:hypothetical protein